QSRKSSTGPTNPPCSSMAPSWYAERTSWRSCRSMPRVYRWMQSRISARSSSASSFAVLVRSSCAAGTSFPEVTKDPKILNQIFVPHARVRTPQRQARRTGGPSPKERVMKLEAMILVSVDDHVCEPPDMWQRHVPAKWKDRAPRLVHKQ